VLVSMGVVPSSEAWLVTGAIYGLTQSPHDWGMHRDGMFRQFRWVCQGETLKLTETPERHLWRIINETTQEEKGYLCSYVDDLLVTGEKAVVDSTIQKIESTWSCSEPEYINDSKNVRFCGYELRWDKDGNLLLMQPSYVLDLLQKYDVKGQEAEPCPKIIFEEKEEYLAETLREAQQITGELLWVQTRTRPDLSYVVGAMSRWLHKRPHYVIQLGHHALRYLANTPHFGLCYGVCDGESWNVEEGLQTPPSIDNVEVFVDSSFSLEHEQYRSVTGVLLMQGNAPISWTSNRQPFIATSTAEAEIIGYSESQQQADGLDQLLQVFGSNPTFNLYGDSRSALSLSTGEGGPWRTRHLRLRAAKLREILRMSREGRDGRQNPKWTARHLPGVKLVADGLTKALHGQAFKNFRSRLHMVDTAIKEDSEPIVNKISTNGSSPRSEKWWAKLILVATLLVRMQKSWMVALGALILTMVKRSENISEEKPKLCALRGSSDQQRQAPIRPSRSPLESQAGYRGQAASSSASYGGTLNQNERVGSSGASVPLWWDHAALQHLPGGKDRWMILEDRWLVRVHGETRRKSFQPIHRSCPVPAERICSDRCTLLYPMSDPSYANRQCRHDTWTSMDLWSKDFLWKGYTIFELRNQEKDGESQQTSSETFPGHGGLQSVQEKGSTPEVTCASDGWGPTTPMRRYGPTSYLRDPSSLNITVNVNVTSGAAMPPSGVPQRQTSQQSSSVDSEFEVVNEE